MKLLKTICVDIVDICQVHQNEKGDLVLNLGLQVPCWFSFSTRDVIECS